MLLLITDLLLKGLPWLNKGLLLLRQHTGLQITVSLWPTKICLRPRKRQLWLDMMSRQNNINLRNK